jgi:biopolymer transport protein ExbD
VRVPHRARPDGGALTFQMTPLIDLVFLLLSYFLFTLSLTALEGVLPSKLALGEDPSEQRQDEDPPDQVILRLVRTGDAVQYFVDEWPVAGFAELAGRLARLPKDTLVVIDAAPTVATAPVIRTYNQCLRLGLSRVVFPVSS